MAHPGLSALIMQPMPSPDAERAAPVLACIEGVLGRPLGSLSVSMRREDLPDWDSLRHMQVVLALEDTFDITLGDDEIMSGWPDLASCVESVLSRTSQTG